MKRAKSREKNLLAYSKNAEERRSIFNDIFIGLYEDLFVSKGD